MPTDPKILGFSNRWFPEAFAHATATGLPSGTQIRLVTAPHFIATKLEAFESRGAFDYMGSKDMEDIATVLHGRGEVVEEASSCSPELRAYLADAADRLLSTGDFMDALEGHLPGENTRLVSERLERIRALHPSAES